MSTDLAIPTSRELEALSPSDRWDIEDAIDEAQGTLREFNDEELRGWVEDDDKSYAEIGRLVDRSRQAVQQRAQRLGLQSADPRGGDRNFDKGLSNPPDIEADLQPAPRTKARQTSPEGPAHHLPDVLAEDADQNLRTQALHWFAQGLEVKELLDNRRPLEPRSDEDRKAIKREAAVMERLARRVKEATDA